MNTVARWQRIDDLFYAAVDLEPGARRAFLQQQCGADVELLREVASLLDSSGQTLGYARKAVQQLARQQTIEPQPAGKRVGAYKLLRILGEGGMGTVYLAARADESYRQEVAIKLMHPGFGPSQDMLLRFSAERQILANLNHPNIARLLDGGMTPDGLPYLVMEYVNGIAIDGYCRLNNLPVDNRLQLFRIVCAAVEYAHKNLVVHRDIKPANILVTAEGVPKLLDFGIAKLLDPQAGNLMPTRTFQCLMTPEYASPEQVRGDQITTATDVYALGVLLYELLAGRRPFQMQRKSPLEVAQIICEQEPDLPSRAMMANPERSAPYAARRLRGDLDNIVLMAMRKEASRRFASVAALSSDVEAYLKGHTVQARTDTWSYRGRKFVRRHRLAVSMAIVAVLALIGFSAGMGLLARRATEERRIADEQRLAAQREADFLARIFNASTPETANGSAVTARELLDQSAKRIDSERDLTPDVQATLLYNLGEAYEQLGLNDQGQPLQERAYALRKKLYGDNGLVVAVTADALAHVYRMGGHYAKADPLFRQALQTAQRAPGDNTPLIARLLTDLAFCLYSESQDTEAESVFRRSLVLNPKPDNGDGAITRSLLAQVLDREGNLSEAWQLANQAVEIVERVEGPTFHLAIVRHILAGVYRDMGDLQKAENVERQALILWRKVGGSHVDVAYSIDNLGVILLDEGYWRQAQPLLQEALSMRQKQLGADHPLLGTSLLDWGRVLQAKGDYAGAEVYFRQALDIQRETIGPENWRLENALDHFALLKLDQGDYAGAESYAIQALEMSRKLGGEEHPEVARSLIELALAREFQGDAAGAEPLLRRALDTRERLFLAGHPAIVEAEALLGETLIDERKPQLAEPILRRAVYSAHHGPFSLLRWQEAEPEHALGVCLAQEGHTAEGERMLKNSSEPLKSYPEEAVRRWMLRHQNGATATAKLEETLALHG